MFTGLVIGSIMTAVGAVGYVITVKKEREEKKLAEKHAEKMRTMEELLNLRKETDKMDFVGLIMYYDIIKSNRKKWVDGLESEIQKNLKDKQ